MNDKEIQPLDLDVIAKKILLKFEDLKRWTENALIENGKYYVVSELTYKGFNENPNWRPNFYILDKEYRLVRIGIEFAKEIALSEKFIECTKEEAKRWRQFKLKGGEQIG